jgi:hypothetical protein
MLLGIFGDSFSADKETIIGDVTLTTYTDIVAKQLGLTAVNFSYPGTSIWYSYKQFVKNYKKFSHIVFCYTDEDRWHYLPDYLHRFSSIYTKEKLDTFPTIGNKEYEEMTDLVKIHKLIHDSEFNNFVFQTIFDKVNFICKRNGIKVINIMPFVNEKNFDLDFSKNRGMCYINLLSISDSELYHKLGGYRHKEFRFFTGGPDLRKNHLTQENNKVLADIILENIDSETYKVIDLYKDKRFSYDVNQLLKYKRLVEMHRDEI